MSERNDGGPAFPCEEIRDDKRYYTTVHTGMTLRDHFAASVLSGIAANPTISGPGGPSLEQVAVRCYEMADAMLKQRED